MGGALLVTLREGFEGALIVSIVLAYLRQIGRRDAFRQVWFGVVAALGVSTIVGAAAYHLLGGLEGDLEHIVFAGVSLVAVAILTWMIFWMRSQSRTIGRRLRQQVERALESESRLGVASVAFFAVLRESLETVLFMLALLLGANRLEWAIGGALGVVGAVLLGYLAYQGGSRINLRLFFTITGALLLVIAAGLIAKSVAWLQESGVVPIFLGHVWDLREQPVVGHGMVSDLLHGLFGWNPWPSALEVVAWLLYVAIVGWLLFGARPRSGTSQSEPVGQRA